MSEVEPKLCGENSFAIQAIYDGVLRGNSKYTHDDILDGLTNKLSTGIELNGSFWWTAVFSHIDYDMFKWFMSKHASCSLQYEKGDWVSDEFFEDFKYQNSEWPKNIALAIMCNLERNSGGNVWAVDTVSSYHQCDWDFTRLKPTIGFNRDRIKLLREQDIVYVGGTTSRNYITFVYACYKVLKMLNVSETTESEPELLRANFNEFIDWTIRIYNSAVGGGAKIRCSWQKCETDYARTANFSDKQMLEMASASTGRLFLHSLKSSQIK